MKSSHILLINKDLLSIPNNVLHPDVETINLHCNYIQEILGLDNLLYLTILDLSANKITSISGITNLPSLQSLNLASNFIRKVDGIDKLFNLKFINLSYNKISSLNGFLNLHGPESNLQVVLLHENQLKDKNHVFSCLKGLVSLRHLVLQWIHIADNSVDQFRNEVFEVIPQLLSLDNVNRHKEPIDVHDDCIDLIGKCDVPVRDYDGLLRKSLDPENSFDEAQNDLDSTKPLKEESDTRTEPDMFENVAEPQILPNNDTDQCTDNTLSEADITSNHSGKNSVKSSKATTTRSSIPVKKFKVGSSCSAEKESLVNILKELESEREQRWKAEHAGKKLAAAVREMQTRDCKEKSIQQTVVDTTERLKRALLTEKKTCDLLRSDIKNKAKQINDLTEKLKNGDHKFRSSVQTLKNNLANANSKISMLQNNASKEKKDLLTSIRHLSDKYESVRLLNQQLKDELEVQIKNVEEIKKNSCSITNDSFQKILANELKKDEKRHQAELALLEHRLQQKQFEFTQLENEFREALVIESERYRALHESYKIVHDNASNCKDLLSASSEKEEEFRCMVSRMSDIIKEQKLKITEISKSKQELRACLEKQISNLQEEIRLCCNKNQRFEKIKQENLDLSSKLFAMQSVVDGLKEERKVWSVDLAQQGVALSKDRGWLEMKIDSLKAEVEALKKNNKRDLDTVKIKTKIIEDQSETISRFKNELSAKDSEIRSKLDEQLAEEEKLLENVESLTNENAMLKEQNNALLSRKQLLKNELSNLQHDYSKLNQEFEQEKLKWCEKGKILMELEQRVKLLATTNRGKLEQVEKERDKALSAIQIMEDKNKKVLTSHQEQLQAANDLHEQEMQRLLRNNREEVARMRAQVDRVEAEMKEILKETDMEKKKMQIKVSQLKVLLEDGGFT